MSEKEFEICWSAFTDIVNGKLLRLETHNSMSYENAAAVLIKASDIWESEYEHCGRWLMGCCKESPEQGKLIKQILFGEMKFEKVESKKKIPVMAALIFAVVAAVAGFLTAKLLLKASLLISAVSAVLPGAAVLVGALAVIIALNRKRNTDFSKEYIGQLEKYKNSIIGILQQK